MKLYVLFVQRECRYEGQYAPEALEVADEFSYEDNPDFLTGKLAEAQANAEFIGAAIIEINLGNEGFKSIQDRLISMTSVKASVTDGDG